MARLLDALRIKEVITLVCSLCHDMKGFCPPLCLGYIQVMRNKFEGIYYSLDALLSFSFVSCLLLSSILTPLQARSNRSVLTDYKMCSQTTRSTKRNLVSKQSKAKQTKTKQQQQQKTRKTKTKRFG